MPAAAPAIEPPGLRSRTVARSTCRPTISVVSSVSGFRSESTWSSACTKRSVASRRRPGNASHWWHWARSLPDWRTRSTTRRRHRCAPSRPCRRRATRMLSSLVNLAEHTITADQYVALDRLRRELADRTAADEGAVATMDREELVGNWLEDRGVDEPWQMAPLFASAGADEAWFEACESVVGSEALGASTAMGVVDHQCIGAAVGVDRHDEPHHTSRRRREVVLADGPRRHATHRHPRWDREHAGDAGPEARRGVEVERDFGAGRAVLRCLCRRAQPGVDQPHRQRHRRDGRTRDTAGCRRASTAPTSSSTSPTAATACLPTSRRASSNRSSPRKTSARAPGSASTSPDESSSSATAARSPSIQCRADHRPRAPPDLALSRSSTARRMPAARAAASIPMRVSRWPKAQ